MPSAKGWRPRFRSPRRTKLRRDNEDLIAALEDVRRQKEELERLNAELQETNRGVMALYGELPERTPGASEVSS